MYILMYFEIQSDQPRITWNAYLLNHQSCPDNDFDKSKFDFFKRLFLVLLACHFEF